MPLLRLAFALLTCFIHGCTGTFLEKSVTGASEPPTSLQCIDSGFGDPQAWTYISTGELEQFQHMYVMSDFHGRLRTAKDLLKATGLFADTNTEGVLEWQSDSAANNSLVIVIGDFINGGNESIEVVRLFEELRKVAPAHHRMVLLIGNHEAQLLAGFPSRFANPEMKKSLSQRSVQNWLGLSDLGQGNEVTRNNLLSAPNFKSFTDSLRLGAVVGPWLFGHSGYFGISTALTSESGKTAAVCDYVEKLTMAYRNNRLWELTLEQHSTSSFLMDHQWWRKKMSNAERNWDSIGLRGLVQGHSRFSMSYCQDEEISCPRDWPGNPMCTPCRNTDGEIYALKAEEGEFSRFIKVDSGIKFDKPGRILSCQITPKLLEDMDLAEDCMQMDRFGVEFDIPKSFNSGGHHLM